jgi:O-antigen/teichoic acid export membrane protein
MLVGYGASQVVNFVVQIGIVRHLSTDEYGAFAWALATVTLLEAIVPLGLDRASPRFLSLYDERREFSRLFGLIVLELSVIAGMGFLLVGSTLALQPQAREIAPSDSAANLLLLLIALAPLHALDAIIVDMFAVFSSPWAVFMRRYVMEPTLRLVVVVLLLMFDGDAQFLVVGFLLVGAFGVGLFLLLLQRLFHRIGLMAHFSWRTLELPWLEVARFCGPVLVGSFVAAAIGQFPAVVLGDNGGNSQVAIFRAVMPFAVLNLGVMFTFGTLFTPSASRLLARHETAKVRDLYWQSAIWVAVLTFPILAVTTAYAAPFTAVTLGERYRASGEILAILSLGFYINAAFGFNGLSIQLLGRNRWILIANLLTLGFLMGATFPLVDKLGPQGAALAVLVTCVVHNILKQLGLGFGGGIGVWQRGHALVLVQVAVLVAGLLLFEIYLRPPLWLALISVTVVWLALLRLTRHRLRLHEVFPELRGYAVLRWLLGGAPLAAGRNGKHL